MQSSVGQMLLFWRSCSFASQQAEPPAQSLLLAENGSWTFGRLSPSSSRCAFKRTGTDWNAFTPSWVLLWAPSEPMDTVQSGQIFTDSIFPRSWSASPASNHWAASAYPLVEAPVLAVLRSFLGRSESFKPCGKFPSFWTKKQMRSELPHVALHETFFVRNQNHLGPTPNLYGLVQGLVDQRRTEDLRIKETNQASKRHLFLGYTYSSDKLIRLNTNASSLRENGFANFCFMFFSFLELHTRRMITSEPVGRSWQLCPSSRIAVLT